VKHERSDVAIIGAGPYGLAAAAHLHAANGLDIRVFGEPMSFWERQMPRGMLLRSPYVASHISDPERDLTLDTFQSETRRELPRPVPLEEFVDYGRWFQTRVFDDLDTRLVRSVDSTHDGFRLVLATGEIEHSRRVVVAAGIRPFAWMPPAFGELPREVASHSSEQRDLARYAGRRVVVVGAGQSALESAALLHEAGGRPELIVRAPRVYFLRRVPRLHRLGPVTRLLFAPAEVGPAGISRLVSAPSWYRRFPRSLQDRMSVRSLRAAGAAWLVERLRDVPLTLGRRIVSAHERHGQVELRLDDGSGRTCDHVLLATGYRVHVKGYSFLSPSLLGQIDQVGGFPRLTKGFESSVPGLYFLGAPSSWSYGPLMRFVAGTEFAAPVLTRAILGRRTKPAPG
jgi:NADPH-dependent 2,4-dienoyl-CoA reductase/sulfur reductase-like enzyme